MWSWILPVYWRLVFWVAAPCLLTPLFFLPVFSWELLHNYVLHFYRPNQLWLSISESNIYSQSTEHYPTASLDFNLPGNTVCVPTQIYLWNMLLIFNNEKIMLIIRQSWILILVTWNKKGRQSIVSVLDSITTHQSGKGSYLWNVLANMDPAPEKVESLL